MRWLPIGVCNRKRTVVRVWLQLSIRNTALYRSWATLTVLCCLFELWCRYCWCTEFLIQSLSLMTWKQNLNDVEDVSNFLQLIMPWFRLGIWPRRSFWWRNVCNCPSARYYPPFPSPACHHKESNWLLCNFLDWGYDVNRTFFNCCRNETSSCPGARWPAQRR